VRQKNTWRFALPLFLVLPIAFQLAVAAPPPVHRSPVIVIGFLGGFVHRDNAIHNEVQLAQRLSEEHRADLFAAAFENHRREQAHAQILKLLDGNRDGALSLEEKRDARVILYGHSWGASETVRLARELESDGIPVLLTVQVDSVAKIGERDSVIPANVAQAVNFYQPHGLFHGRQAIRAADTSRTGILGNFRFDYSKSSVECKDYPAFARAFMGSHIKIECDPAVWSSIERLIRSRIPPADAASLARTQ